MLFSEPRVALQRAWSETTWQMQSLRDNPESRAAGVRPHPRRRTTRASRRVVTFDPADDVAAPFVARGARPPIAILRDQGVNGEVEMAAAFDRAGFEAHDVHMSDIIEGRVSLARFRGFAACGGFSYGDVLGGGEGWAKSILYNPRARDEFAAFFARPDTFALGVCNGCQMMAALKELIPGAEAWPRFVKNTSEQFEARLVDGRDPARARRCSSRGMEGSRLPVVTAHGEGRAAVRAAGSTPSRVIAAGAVRRQPRPADRDLPAQPERLGRRAHGGDDGRRPVHRDDAAPRARVPDGAVVVAPARVGRGQPVDAALPQRARVRRLRRGRDSFRPITDPYSISVILRNETRPLAQRILSAMRPW